MIKEKYTLKDFYPLIGLFAIITTISVGTTLYQSADTMFFMRMFMGWFFILFGFLKVINIKAFAEAYTMYDIVASRSRFYSFLYPFIELGLGIAYIFGIALFYTNIVTLVVMLTGALGVYLQLRKGETIMCACLGVVFKVPMTWVTLVEDMLMATMAGGMIFFMISTGNSVVVSTNMQTNTPPTESGGGMMMHDTEITNDKEFLLHMIPHHQEAVDTANEVLERGGEIGAVKILAQNIIAAQEKEISDMKSWYRDWYGAEYENDGSYEAMMRELEELNGKDLDIVFITDMMIHHMGAIHAAVVLLDFTKRDELITLGNNILITQRQEIMLMQEILAKNR